MNDRFKCRYWNKETNSYTTGGAIKNGGVVFIKDEESFTEPADYIEIEQCTGLRDNTKILIYEKDIIQCYGTKFEIYYDDLKCGLLLRCLESNGNEVDAPFCQVDHSYTFEDLMGFENWEHFVNRVNLKVIDNVHNIKAKE